jgi:hypothetical protein
MIGSGERHSDRFQFNESERIPELCRERSRRSSLNHL